MLASAARSPPSPIPPPGPDTTRGADSAGIGIRYGSVVRFRDILRDVYGADPGDFETRAHRLPSGSVLGKVTVQLGVNSRLEVSHNWFHADQRFEGEHDYQFIGFSSNGFHVPLTVNATRLNWSAAFGRRWTNELLLARVHEGNTCVPEVEFPSVDVIADSGHIVAGSFGCGGLKTTESIWELTDNLGLEWGTHRLTLGMHHELLQLLSAFRAPDEGAWLFQSLDSLDQGLPFHYERNLPGPLAPEGPRADFPVRQLGFYLQDQWAPTIRLTLTAGLRLDVPFLPDEPPQNPDLLAGLGINTAVTPSGHALWSPRLGVSYDVSGRGSTFLRGGIGLFAGRPLYVWFRDAQFQTGLQQARLACEGHAIRPVHARPRAPADAVRWRRRAGADDRVLRPRLPVSEQPQGLARGRPTSGVGHGGNGGYPVHERGESVRGAGRQPGATDWGPAAGEGGRSCTDRSIPRPGASEPTRRNPGIRSRDRDVQPLGRPRWSLAVPASEALCPGHRAGRRLHLYRRPGPAKSCRTRLLREPDRESARRHVGAPRLSAPRSTAGHTSSPLTGTFDLPL